LTGEMLFQGKSTAEIYKKNKACLIDLTDMATKNKYSDEVLELLLLMLEKDPDTRISPI